MCELLGLSSNVPTTLSLSLRKLAEHGGPPASIADGWGVAYYEGRDVRLIKDCASAEDRDWVRFIADHDLRSQIVVSHIRKATTMGERAYRNTQPFTQNWRAPSTCSRTMAGCPKSWVTRTFGRRFTARSEKRTPNMPSAACSSECVPSGLCLESFRRFMHA